MCNADSRQPSALRGSGFSLLEALVTVGVLALLASLSLPMFNKAKVATADTKLRTDVVRLNQLVALYLGDGGTLDGLMTAQSVMTSSRRFARMRTRSGKWGL